MNTLLLCFAVIALFAVGTFAKDHCLDSEFTTRAALFNPTKKYDDVHEIFFSVKNQAQRVDIHEFFPHIKRTTVYLAHNEGKMYVFDRSESKCESMDLQGKLEQFCLAKDAEHEGQITIGGSLKADIWQEQNEHGSKIRFVLGAANNVPINTFGRYGHHVGEVFQEFFNFRHGVEDPEKTFAIPKQCKQATNAPVSEEAKAYAKQVAQLLAPITRQ